MDVTRDNFAEAADELEGLLATCKFVAFDEEMTGIRLDHSTEPAWCDTVEERYAKMKRVAEHFLLMQVGICCVLFGDGGGGCGGRRSWCRSLQAAAGTAHS
jgi:hypothetical protein